MKKLLQCSLVCLLVLAGSSSWAQDTAKVTQSTNNTGSLRMKGAYTMLRQVGNDGTNDSLMNSEQFKIYTDKYMIYVHPKAGDSLAEYGIGLYEVKNGKVREYVFHTSDSGARKDTFELNIFKIGDGYRQTIFFPASAEGRAWTLIEDYMSVGKNTTSPLDGAWKQTRAIRTAPDGRKQTIDKPTQFKVYESGHFIWVNSTIDSVTKKPV